MIPLISGSEARELISEHGAILIDVRNPHEFAAGSAPGAINVPLHLLPVRAQEFDMKKPVVVFCLSGARSHQARQFLMNMGFSNVKNVGSLQNFINS